MPLANASYRVKPVLDPEKMTVLVQVVNRDSDEVVASRTYDAKEIAANLRTHVALYGLSKLLSDRTSQVNFSENSNATPEEKLTAMDEVHALLKQGVWEKERKAGGPTIRIEIEALAALKGTSVKAMQAKLQTLTKEDREKILAAPAVVAKAAELEAARKGSEDIDLSDLSA